MGRVGAKVVVRDLEKQYGGVKAASGVSFSIEEGEIFGLLGPNGAGKTTTLECVVGLRDPDRGEIKICDVDARQHPREVRQRFGAALQTTALPGRMTPREALELFGSFYSTRIAPDTLLERFALADHADAAFDTLSGGYRQRLALALAFVNAPDLLFLDEPTAGLDAQTRHDLRARIAGMKAEGHTVLLTTHDLAEAEELCDRVAILARGRVVATGAPRELTARAGSASTVSLWISRPIGAAVLAQVGGVEDVVSDGTHVRFRTSDAARTLAGVLAVLREQSVDITELHLQKATLEEVFLELTGTEQ